MKKLSNTARVATAVRVYDLVFAKTESFELNNVGAALAYLLGAILKNETVQVWRGTKDLSMGALYDILTENLDGDDPIMTYVEYVDEMSKHANSIEN